MDKPIVIEKIPIITPKWTPEEQWMFQKGLGKRRWVTLKELKRMYPPA